MSAQPAPVAPKNGDHVTSSQHEGTFEVVGVNALMQTANIRRIDGTGHVVPNVAWIALKKIGHK
jgi:hypothetical protein